MATTIEPEGDPTFLAYERARQFSEKTLKRNAETGQARASEDVQRGGMELAMNQANQIYDNTADARDRGAAFSSGRFRQEDRIRSDIALRVSELLSGYQRTSQDITTSLEDDLARMAMEKQTQESDARRRLTKDNASSGVGI